MMQENNRREMTRIPFPLTVTIQSKSAPDISGLISNVSLKGLYISTKTTLPQGSQCQITLHINPAEASSVYELEGVVARVDDRGMAVEINETLPIETFTYLQNVVRYNAVDTTTIDQELYNRLSRRWKQKLSKKLANS